MFQLICSRSGHPTLSWNGKNLHSLYDPVKESRRFIDQMLLDSSPSRVVLLGPGLGYLTMELKRRLPRSEIVGIYYSRQLQEISLEKTDFAWNPEDKTSLQEFLTTHLTELDLPGLRILEWPSSGRMFPEEAKFSSACLNRTIREIRGNFVTVSAAGKKWVHNSIINVLGIDTIWKGLETCEKPVVIAASGPTLEGGLDLLMQYRGKYSLWALPSAVPSLLARALIPDLIVVTDPSYFSIWHLHPAKGKNIPIAMPMSASTGVWRITNRVLLLRQPNFFEAAVLTSTGVSTISIPAVGTVAGSALELAAEVSSRAVFFFGLDMCSLDILSHARPNRFETFAWERSSRISPYYGQTYCETAERIPRRQGQIRTSLPLDTYADWLTEWGRHRKKTVYRCLPSPRKLRGIDEIGASEFESLMKGVSQSLPNINLVAEDSYPSRTRRTGMIRDLLTKWLRDLKREKLRLQRDSGVMRFFEPSEFHHLCYFLDLPRLAEIKKSMGKNALKNAVDTGTQLIDNGCDFIHQLAKKIGADT